LAADEKRESQIEVCPNRGVIGRIFTFAHFAIDTRRCAFLRKRFGGKNGVEAKTAIFWESQHPIIPPCKNARRLRMQSERISQTDRAELLKRGPLAVRAHDGATPKLRIVNIDIFRRDIEIAAHDQIRVRFVFQAIAQPRVPFEFVFVSGRTDRLSVRRVNRIDAKISNRRRNHARLRIDNFIAKRCANVSQLGFRKNRHAVVGFFAVIGRIVTRRLERQRRKLFVGAFRFLQTNDVRLGALEPFE
jgi:hypothetical protein